MPIMIHSTTTAGVVITVGATAAIGTATIWAICTAIMPATIMAAVMLTTHLAVAVATMVLGVITEAGPPLPMSDHAVTVQALPNQAHQEACAQLTKLPAQ